jgi:AraC-like DNA-binding protein/quercetin dioxygenase-like cupin family protein
MKPLIQKLPLNEETSFVAKTFRTPHFEVGWHQHFEYELILFTEGSGMSFIGNYVGEFETGDIFFLGSNLPHTFQKSGAQVTSAIVVQFRDDFWGNQFLEMPESRGLKKLLQASLHGLKITENSKAMLAKHIKQLEHTHGFKRVLLLAECLYIMDESNEYKEVSTQEITVLTSKDKQCIDRVFQFTIDSFKEPVTLSEVAAIACMSVPAFCRYFKRSTQKTYTEFLNEVRIGYACNLLQDTQKTVLEICYESGYNSIANFHRQFFKIKSYTPLQYRKYFTAVQPHYH